MLQLYIISKEDISRSDQSGVFLVLGLQVISWIFTPEMIQLLSKGIKNWVTLFSYQRLFSVIFDLIGLI